MAEELTKEQFRAAVADAALGIVNVYREVDLLLRELGAALASQPAAFGSFGGRVVPGTKKNPDARYLRNYLSVAYKAGEVDDGDDAEGDGEEDEEPGVEGDAEEEDAPKRVKRPLWLVTGECLLIARVSIYQRGEPAFEPSLHVGVLTGCRVEPGVEPGVQIRVPRGRFRGLLRTFATHRGKVFRFKQPVQPEGQPKGKAKHKLVFDLPEEPLRKPLFDVTMDTIPTIAAEVQHMWNRVADK